MESSECLTRGLIGRFARLALPTMLLAVAPWVHAQTLDDEAVAWLQDFIRIDTINPPGNESRAVDFLAGILDAEGIAWNAAESAPGRGNLWARLEGGDERISEAAFRRGVHDHLAIIEAVVYD